MAREAAKAYSKFSGFNVEDFMVDLFYWFENSGNRVHELREFSEFCEQCFQNSLSMFQLVG